MQVSKFGFSSDAMLHCEEKGKKKKGGGAKKIEKTTPLQHRNKRQQEKLAKPSIYIYISANHVNI